MRRNAKVADVYLCVAVEDLPISQGVSRPQVGQAADPITGSGATSDIFQQLKDCGLGDINFEGCGVSEEWKRLAYQDVFSKDKLDRGEAKGFVHRIHRTDDRPFRLPYRRVPQPEKCCLRWS